MLCRYKIPKEDRVKELQNCLKKIAKWKEIDLDVKHMEFELTWLMLAVNDGVTVIVQKLLKASADLEMRDKK